MYGDVFVDIELLQIDLIGVIDQISQNVGYPGVVGLTGHENMQLGTVPFLDLVQEIQQQRQLHELVESIDGKINVGKRSNKSLQYPQHSRSITRRPTMLLFFKYVEYFR
jgi:hypothetical protein